MFPRYNPDKHLCKNCIFFHKYNNCYGYCHAHPPIAFADEAAFPSVKPDDTCGEYFPQRKEAPK